MRDIHEREVDKPDRGIKTSHEIERETTMRGRKTIHDREGYKPREGYNL